jgi:tetratricopeptide (TPR) repeat protein
MVMAQSGKSLAEAERFYGIKAYESALPKFLEAIQAGEKDPMAHYKTGICYQKSADSGEQLKAIPYFEYALTNGKGLPTALYYDLAGLYLRDENIQKALQHYNTYKDLSKADKKAVALADEGINVCGNAMALMSVPRNFKVTAFNSIINTKFTEYNPVVSADESVLAYTPIVPIPGKPGPATNSLKRSTSPIIATVRGASPKWFRFSMITT